MNKLIEPTPTSRCRVGVSRCDITPPVGIYHRFWGAAKHDRATGVHRPLTATVLAMAPLKPGTAATDEVYFIVAVDHCLFRTDEMRALHAEISKLSGIDHDRIIFTFSHTHSGGNITRDRANLPGGDLIAPYLDSLPEKISVSINDALEKLQPAVVTYGTSTCNMGWHRDFWDSKHEHYVCGFNPKVKIELPLHVVRYADDQGASIATAVNYPCHPTTLAWDNTLISPDYIGALRETVEKETGVPCVFLLAPCGDIGPKYGFVGDTSVADCNGRQVGYAALSEVAALPSPGCDYHYSGPVISGATIGCWEYQPQPEKRQSQTGLFRHRRWTVELDYLSNLPTVTQIESDLEELLSQETAARNNGDTQQSRDLRALAERKRRELERIRPLPPGDRYPYWLNAWQMGDAFWVAIEGEPYHALQQQLNARFPDRTIIIIELANGSTCSYLPGKADYEKETLYQVGVAMLQPGSLEKVTDAIAAQIADWIESD